MGQQLTRKDFVLYKNLLDEEASGMLEKLLQQVRGVSTSTFFSLVQYAVDHFLGMILCFNLLGDEAKGMLDNEISTNFFTVIVFR